ncbi:ArdC-like ssDNA-binding domain-containing protein [Cupriavidus sp. D39]|uniref:ArdC-like ssDNA-binding domain-containing protein n=1 Tax=Cupriavidus sp. D39 TaxID=2997877 RepID=UPI00226FAE42|nr:ArdC-like ssDNA-binding domain-containing protein [Cupriavidus sp. D39]MCY0853054.1 ArdC-like ssDNA-binding domain-containing protein [Cupriavidus sp. D39]
MARDYRGDVATRLAELFDAGEVPWHGPYRTMAGLPFNPSTGKLFRGGNAVALMASGYSDPRWCTYRQAAANGWHVRQGQTSTVVEFWKYADVVERQNESGEIERVRVPRERPTPQYVHVFNVEQMERVPQLEVARGPEAKLRAEAILTRAHVPIFHDGERQPIYVEARDAIYARPKAAFASEDHYYAEALRLVGEAAMAPNRLNVTQSLQTVAERSFATAMAGMFVAGRLGLEASNLLSPLYCSPGPYWSAQTRTLCIAAHVRRSAWLNMCWDSKWNGSALRLLW